MKKTVLAGKARLNYAALVRYVKFLQTLRWVDSTADSSANLITITAIGRSFKKLLERQESPSDISEEVLVRLVAQSNEQKPKVQAGGMQTKSLEIGVDNKAGVACYICGTAIKGRSVTREVEDKKYFFDKRECATLFVKFRDVYGSEFLS